MPHFIIEYSAQQVEPEQVEQMLDAVERAAIDSGLFEPGHIRIRALPYTHYRNGGGYGHFIHAQLRIHAGRDEAQKHRLSGAVLHALKEQAWPAHTITVEVIDMDRNSYAKHAAHREEK